MKVPARWLTPQRKKEPRKYPPRSVGRTMTTEDYVKAYCRLNGLRHD